MKRSLLLIAAVAAAVVASKLLIEDAMAIDLERAAAAWVANAGSGSAAMVVALLGIDLFLPVPSSFVMILSGAAFGVLWGSLLSLAGSVGGEWLGFELVRRYGRGVSGRIVGEEEIKRLERVFARHGAAAVVITRALPVVMETMSVVAGLSAMPRSAFLLASVAGTAPIVVVYAYAGAVSREMGSLIPAVVMLIAVAGGALIWYRARMAERPDPRVAPTAVEASEGEPQA